MGHRLGNRLFGDCIEGDACDILGQCLFLLQHFLHMPADCFPLAIRVGCEDQAIGLLCLVCDGFQLLGLVWVIVPQHGKAVFGIYRSVLGRQIADMAIGGQHLISASQILLDCLRFGG